MLKFNKKEKLDKFSFYLVAIHRVAEERYQ